MSIIWNKAKEIGDAMKGELKRGYTFGNVRRDPKPPEAGCDACHGVGWIVTMIGYLVCHQCENKNGMPRP